MGAKPSSSSRPVAPVSTPVTTNTNVVESTPTNSPIGDAPVSVSTLPVGSPSLLVKLPADVIRRIVTTILDLRQVKKLMPSPPVFSRQQLPIDMASRNELMAYKIGILSLMQTCRAVNGHVRGLFQTRYDEYSQLVMNQRYINTAYQSKEHYNSYDSKEWKDLKKRYDLAYPYCFYFDLIETDGRATIEGEFRMSPYPPTCATFSLINFTMRPAIAASKNEGEDENGDQALTLDVKKSSVTVRSLFRIGGFYIDLYASPQQLKIEDFSRQLIEAFRARQNQETPTNCVHTEHFETELIDGRVAMKSKSNYYKKWTNHSDLPERPLSKNTAQMYTPSYYDGRCIECGVGEIEAEELEGGCCYAVVEEMVDRIVMDPDAELRKRVTKTVARDCFETGMTRMALAKCILDVLNDTYATSEH